MGLKKIGLSGLLIARAIGFVLFFLKELFVSSFRVAVDVLSFRSNFTPGVIAFPLRAERDIEIVLLANVISLTPGTLSLEVSADRKWLYIHAMYAADVEQVRNEIQNGLEKKLLEVTRTYD